MIDFGDAFISHPALDLRRWPHPHDRTAIMEGYCSAAPVNGSFLQTWQVVMVLANLAVLARSSEPELMLAEQEDLEAKLAGLIN